MGQGSADATHTIVEAVKLAYADRDRYYADPDFARVPGQALLSPEYAAVRRALIDPKRASTEQIPGDPERGAARLPGPTDLRTHGPTDPRTQRPTDPAEPGDTTAIQVADAAGNLFSATPSSGWLLGGAFVAGDTGVPMSNRMQAFRLDPSSPNVLAGGKRPRTTLTPTIVLKDGRPFLAIGTPGGDSQDQQILLVLLNVIDFNLGLQAAIEAPRVNSLHPQSSFDDHRAQPGVLEVERSLSPAVIEELRGRGHTLRLRPPYGISTGIVAAGFDPATGRLRVGADPRRERALVAY
jgi:gamma-glutamyltranspeptidase/glutathione hydrolase